RSSCWVSGQRRTGYGPHRSLVQAGEKICHEAASTASWRGLHIAVRDGNEKAAAAAIDVFVWARRAPRPRGPPAAPGLITPTPPLGNAELAEAYLDRGSAYFRSSNPKQALRDLDRAI